MSIELHLESMSVAEKLQVMEMVWASLCRKPADVIAPAWHEEVLKERTQRLEAGEASVSKWSDARRRLQDLGQ